MNMLLTAFVLTCLSFTLAGGSAGGQPGLTVRERAWLAAASRTDKAGWVVLRLAGDPDAVGFQRGYLSAREIGGMRADLAYLVRRDTGKDWGFFVAAAKKQFTGRIPGEYERELRGIAAGARRAGVEIDYDEVVFLNGCIDLLWYWWDGVKEKLATAGPGCSAFIAAGTATGGRGVVMGHNSWTSLVLAKGFNIVVDLTPARGHRIVMQTLGPALYSVSDFFVTGAGLVGTETTIGGYKGYREEGVPVFVRARRAMQYADTIDDWVRLVAEKNNGAYANSWLLGDVKRGEIARFELGLKFQRLERRTNGWFSGSNVAEDPAILRLETGAPYDDVRDFAVARRVRWEKLLADNEGRIDIALARRMLADHVDSYLGRDQASWRTICGHGWEDDGRVPGGCQPYLPAGAFDGKVLDSAMARRMAFTGRWGVPCGTAFRAAAFLAAHPQYRWLRERLVDIPARPWVELPGER